MCLIERHETRDIDHADLDRLFREVELRVLVGSQGNLTCGEVMSRDVIKVGLDGSAERARELLIAHNFRTLPVVDGAGRLAGTIGLRELTLHGNVSIAQVISEARTAGPDEPAVSLAPSLTDGRTHAVMVVDDDRQIIGIITQTDLLATLTRLLSAKTFTSHEPQLA